MKHSLYILSLAVMLLSSLMAYGQTPFDAFSPETSRPILDGDSIAVWRAEQKADTILCAIVADLRHEQLLLVDLTNESVLAYAPFTEEMKNWMSVDPLADKNINVTPYLYCNGNPVMLVDPDGRDEFEVHWDSNANKVTIKQIENKDYDQFHIVDAEGNRLTSSEQYAYNTITKLRKNTWGDSNLVLFDVRGDDNARGIFEFLGSYYVKKDEYYKDCLEWSLVMVGTCDSGRNIIGTSMKENATGVGHFIMSKGYTIREVDHNHPWGTNPSDTDIDNAKIYHSKFPNAQLSVFSNGKYLPYDENTLKLSTEGGSSAVCSEKKK